MKSRIFVSVVQKIQRKSFYTIMWRLYLKLCRFLSIEVVNSAYGIRLVSNYGDATFNFYLLGVYGYFLSDFLNGLKDDFYFLDIGANQGLYSIIAAKNANCKKVFAFEPIPKTFDILKKNIFLNGVDSKSVILKKAIDEEILVKKIYFNPNHSGTASLIHNNNSDTCSEAINIECVDYNFLNDIFSDIRGKIFIKIDVEGYELIVMQQIFKTKISSSIFAVFYEVDKRWVEDSEIRGFLKKFGFSNFHKIGDNNIHYDVLAFK